MKVSELRYARDRRKLDVAARLIHFEVRTGTIRELTGLTDTRIRSLSKDCGIDGSAGATKRHRGASPHKVQALLKTPRPREEAATVLGICHLMGLRDGVAKHEQHIPHVPRAERLCNAYWTFRNLFPNATISFEHMLLLLTEAAKGDEMEVTRCKACEALLVLDSLALNEDVCAQCVEASALAPSSRLSDRARCVAEESPPAYE